MELPEKKKRPDARREEPDEPEVNDVAEDMPAIAVNVPEPPAQAFPLEEEDQMALLRALHVQIKAGIDGAKERLEKINRLLLG